VNEGAKKAELFDISSVRKILKEDSAHKTKEALESLSECEFMHSIDAPSLAL
jgi:hypothetical protein